MRENPAGRPTLSVRKFGFMLRYLHLVADIPRPASAREKLASVAFGILVFLARFSFLIGLVAGCIVKEAEGMLIGLSAGAILGGCVGRNLGLRGSNLKYGFFVRMRERGNGDHPRFLESVIEKLRGEKLPPRTCRVLTSLYAEMLRDLQCCSTAAERKQVREKFDQKFRIVLEKGNSHFPTGDCEYSHREVAVEP